MIKLLLPSCKKLLKDKLELSPPDSELELVIQQASNNNLRNKQQTDNEYHKVILSAVLQIFQKRNTLEYAVSELEHMRNQPVVNINKENYVAEEEEISYDNNPTQHSPSHINLSLPNSFWRTHLVTISNKSSVIKLPSNSKIVPFCIIYNDNTNNNNIITITINNNYLCHFYKNNNVWKTIKDLEPFTTNTSTVTLDTNAPLNINSVYIKKITQIDEYQYSIDLNNSSKYIDFKVSVKDNIYNFYHVENKTYIIDSNSKITISQFLNAKCIFPDISLNILFKFQTI